MRHDHPGERFFSTSGSGDQTLSGVVEALCGYGNGEPSPLTRSSRAQELPSRDRVVQIVEDLRSVLFPGYFGVSEMSTESMRFHVGSTLDRVVRMLTEQVKRGLCFFCEKDDPGRCPECESRSRTMTESFLGSLPKVQDMLAHDVRAAYEGDPAAGSTDEAIFCYPGILAITSHRIAHELQLLGVPLIPRMIAEHAHGITGIDIHPGARIEQGLFIDHGTGVVVGETARIGLNVRIYQGVTLGALSFPLDEDGRPVKGVIRHPVVEDDVIIYSGATILGHVTIGRGSVIGGNVWLTRSVPPASRVTQAQYRREEFAAGSGI